MRASARRNKKISAQSFAAPNKRDWHGDKVRAHIRREARLMAQHPEDNILNEWIEATYDWDAWK